MPYYQFLCKNQHSQELKMSFREHELLSNEPTIGSYIECNVKYGDKDQPVCSYRAYQVFDKNVAFPGLESAKSWQE